MQGGDRNIAYSSTGTEKPKEVHQKPTRERTAMMALLNDAGRQAIEYV